MENDLAAGVAANGRLGVGNLAHDGGRQLDGDHAVVVEHGLADILHAVFDKVQRVTQVFLLDFVLVVFGVHEYVHRIGEVGVGHFLALEDDRLELVVGLVDAFGGLAVEQVL